MPPKKKPEAVPAHRKGAARFARVKNTLKMGLVGLPNVGKSSSYNLLTGQQVPAENFPFCTIDPSTSRCQVQDERYEKLCTIWKSPSQIPAWLNITDIAGLVRGASEGAGLGNDFLSHIQAVDGIFHVVRAFDNPEVTHVDDSIDPIRDMETIQSELCKKDKMFYEAAVAAENLAIKKNPKMKLSPVFLETMRKVGELLDNNKPLALAEWTEGEAQMIKDKLNMLITIKPMVYIVNLDRKSFVKKKNKWLKKIVDHIQANGGGKMIPYSVEYEEELNDAGSAEAAEEIVKETGAKSSLNKIIKAGYDDLALQQFFTAGEKEVRAWTVQSGSFAPEAAGVIHTDFIKNFIKVEVVSWPDFDALQDTKGLDKVKAAGKWSQKGKDYVMQDGDVVHFQIGGSSGKKK